MIVVHDPPAPAATRRAIDPGGVAPLPLFSEWANPYYLDARPRPDPGPCPVCHAPSHACIDHVSMEDLMPTRETRIQGTTGVNADPDSGLYVCPDDVVEEFVDGPPGRAKRTSHRLLHHKGEVISRNRAIQLGLVEGQVTPPPIPPAPGASVEGPPVTLSQQ